MNIVAPRSITSPKPRKRKRPGDDKTHLHNIALLPCMVCGRGPVQVHHLLRVPGGKRGMGSRNEDRWAVPLCVNHHRELHADGNEVRWFTGMNIVAQVEIAEKLWAARERFGEMLDIIRMWPR